MRVPVQHCSGPRRKSLLLVLSLLGITAAGLLISFGRDSCRDWASAQILAMGGTASGSLWTDLGLLRQQAWPKQNLATAAGKPIPTLRFDVKFKAIKKLAKKRQEALQRNYLIQEEDDYVNATVRIETGDQHSMARVRLRLKGDFTDHLKGEKWSFRVKTKGDDQVLGMRVFSLQHPRVRGYAHEPVFLDHMRREGVLAPRYSFIHLLVNGNDKGLMALEEHFSKELLESQQRRDSVIVRFDESLKWRTVHLMGQEMNFTAAYPYLKPFQASKLVDNPGRRAELDAAVSRVRGFLSRDLRPSAVFDPDLTARYLAVCEIWGARHAQAWNNLRFYYNPLTGLLEPIAFDANLQDYAFRFIPTCLVSTYDIGDDMTARWLADERIRRPFLRHLRRLSNEFVQQASIDIHQAAEHGYYQVLHREFPLLTPIPFDFLRLRSFRLGLVTEQNYGRLPLMPPDYPTLLHAFLAPSPSGHRLDLYNLVPYPLEILRLQLGPESLHADRTVPITLPPTTGLAAPTPLHIELSSPEDLQAVVVTITARILGYPHSQKEFLASAYPMPATTPVLPEVGWANLLAAHPYLRRQASTLSLGPGEIQIDTPMILPPGAALTVAPGTTLRFAPNALLLVRGSLDMPGTEQQPIRLLPSRETWSGVAVLGSHQTSNWSHVTVSHTTGLRHGDWHPTGSVMFYQCKVQLRDCSFTDNQSEDALNLVHSEFELHNIRIERTSSDAIDMDFCRGEFIGGMIQQAAGDGIDVSETQILVRGTEFDAVLDKALSVGERSKMQVDGVTIKNCGTGLTSKDDSVASIENSSMTSIKHVAVMAYTKKPEFGGAQVHVKNLQVRDTPHLALAQTGSMVEIDGTPIAPVEIDIEALYATGYMKKD